MTRFAFRAAAAAFLFATAHPVRAEPPTCGAPTVIDILRERTIDEFKGVGRTSGYAELDALNKAADKIYLNDGVFDIKVDQMFAVSRSEDVRECRAMMHLVEPGRVSGDSPVLYSVTRSEDGHDLVAINDQPTLHQNLRQSLTANNSAVRDAVEALRRDLFAGERSLKSYGQPPSFNKPATPAYPSSSFGGTGNRGSLRERHLNDFEE